MFLIGIMIRCPAIVHSYQFSVSFYCKCNTVLCIRHQVAIFICHIYGNIAKILSVCQNGSTVCMGFQPGCFSGCGHTVSSRSGNRCSVFILCNRSKRAICVWNHPGTVQILVVIGILITIQIHLIGIASIASVILFTV